MLCGRVMRTVPYRAAYHYNYYIKLRAPIINGLGHATRSATRYTYLSQATCVIVSGFKAALGVDTYPLSNLIHPRCAERAKPGRGKPVLIMHIGFSLVFAPYLPNAVVSAKSPHSFSCPCSTEAVGIAHKPPRSL